MVTLKVIKPFYDLKLHRGRKEGETFEVTEERAEVLLTQLPDYVAVVEPVDLTKMSLAELTALAKERGIQYKGRATKAALIQLLSEV